MATQGLVSIVSNKKVLMKIVCGCEGYNAPKLATALKGFSFPIKEKMAYHLARKNNFGCDNCLFVITETSIFGKDEDDCEVKDLEKSGEFDSPLYRSTFNKAKFNPRWKLGTADYTIVINVETRENHG
jgi:hypothetical protein